MRWPWFALSHTHDVTKAEDLIQDAWFVVLKVKGPWNRGYLFTTIRNRFIDSYGRERLTTTEPLHYEADLAEPQKPDSVDHDDVSFVVNGQFDEALGRLRVEERAVLYLSAVEDYTAQQIAELLDWPRHRRGRL